MSWQGFNAEVPTLLRLIPNLTSKSMTDLSYEGRYWERSVRGGFRISKAFQRFQVQIPIGICMFSVSFELDLISSNFGLSTLSPHTSNQGFPDGFHSYQLNTIVVHVRGFHQVVASSWTNVWNKKGWVHLGIWSAPDTSKCIPIDPYGFFYTHLEHRNSF